jgi:hypothetical protein
LCPAQPVDLVHQRPGRTEFSGSKVCAPQ